MATMEVVTLFFTVSAGLLSLIFLLSVWNRRYGPYLSNYPDRNDGPKVSILIPARNEADNLRQLLPRLLASAYANYEILVLDDHSTDNSKEVARTAGIPVLQSEPLPAGWTGKNWACWQLAQKAQGDIFLFIDADVLPAPLAVARTVGCMESENLAGLSSFPRQIYDNLWLAATVPFIMELPIVGWIPMAAVSSRRFPYFMAANGQWLAVRRTSYFLAGGHSGVRSNIVDDIALANRIRQHGTFKTFYGSLDVSVRMYKSYGQMQLGFSKNLFLLCGGSWMAFLGFLGFYTLVYIVPVVAAVTAPWTWGMALLALTFGWRWNTATVMKSPKRAIWLHPVGVLLAGQLLLLSAARTQCGGNTWKGRRLTAPAPR
jgi:glycosyltransferase involved in cell wall biosynthesis